MYRIAVGLCGALFLVASVHGADDELKNLKPGTLLILDFGGRSVCEFKGYSPTGWLRVRKKTLSGERESTHSPGSFTLAPPGAVFGQSLADEDAPKELQNLKAGTKLLVNSGGETIGEFIEYSKLGRFKVRVLSATGSEQTPTLSAKYVIRLAKPDEPFGWRSPEKPAEPRLPPKPATRPTGVAGPTTPPRGPGQPVFPGSLPGLPGRPGGPPTRMGRPGSGNPSTHPLHGSWKVVGIKEDGQSRPERLPMKIVIDRNEIQFETSAPLPLKIDAGPKPGTMDIGEDPATYNLNEDTLIISKSNGAPRSTELYVCERCVSFGYATPLPSGSPGGPHLTAMDRVIEELKARRYRKHVLETYPPDKKPPLSNDMLEQRVAELQTRGPRLVVLLQAIHYMLPQVNADRTEVVYDVSDYHIDGASADSRVVFRKRAGRWYYVDPRDLQPKPSEAEAAGPKPPAPAAASTAPPTVATPAPAKSPGAVDPDLTNLLGSWQVVRFEEGGKEKPDAVPYKIRFSPQVLMLSTLPMEQFRVNSATTPKQLDYGMYQADTTAVYELNGDQLRICYNTKSGNPRPVEFNTKAGDGRNLLTCRRAKRREEWEKMPLSQAEPEAAARLAEFDKIIQSQGVLGFVEQCIAPAQRKKLSAAQREEMKRVPAERINGFLLTLKAAQRVAPTLDAARSQAVFDLSGFDVPDADPERNIQELKLTKVDGKWYLMER